MSNYNSLKTTINANIKQNGIQSITGQILNSVLTQMVNALGAGYQFAGVATTATNPGSPDAKVFYIAAGKGTFTNFGGLSVTENDVVILYWDSAWHKMQTGIAYASIVGSPAETFDWQDEESVSVSGFGAKITLPVDVKTGETISLTIGGTAVRNTTRVYVNRAGGTPIQVSDVNGTFTYTAQEDISSLFIYAAVTTAGTYSAEVRLRRDATGLIKEVMDMQEIKSGFGYALPLVNYSDWGTNTGITKDGNNITGIYTNANPAFSASVSLSKGKKYYVAIDVNVTQIYANGFNWLVYFNPGVYESVPANIGRNIILIPFSVANNVSGNLTLSMYSQNATSGDVIGKAQVNQITLIESDTDIFITDKEMSVFVNNGIYIPKYPLAPSKGWKWYALGDSLTAQAKYIPKTINEMLFASCTNLGVGGKRASGTDGMWKSAYLSQIGNDADIITLMCGTNDWAQNAPLGDIDSTDTDTYCGALNSIISSIATDHPNSLFVIMCSPVGVFPNREGWSAPWVANSNGDTMMDFADAAYRVASARGVPCARVGQNVGWNQYNITTFVQYDGAYLHPNEKGGERIASVLIGFLKSIL